MLNAQDISVEDLADRLKAGSGPVVLDVREPWEVALSGTIAGSVCIPLGELAGRVGELPGDQTVVVVCHHGFRSGQATAWLRHSGFGAAWNLSGGIDAWARRVDPTIKVY
jgi:rhodanese-related sulfurtransferase